MNLGDKSFFVVGDGEFSGFFGNRVGDKCGVGGEKHYNGIDRAVVGVYYLSVANDATMLQGFDIEIILFAGYGDGVECYGLSQSLQRVIGENVG